MLHRAGYDECSADALLRGGMRAVPVPTFLRDPDWLSIRNASLFGRLARTSDLARISELVAEDADYLICDSYYQHTFPAWPLEPLALYGTDGIEVGRPAVDLPGGPPLRVRHRSVPTYRARTFEELERVAAAVRGAQLSSEKVLFRGQTAEYLIHRPAEVRDLLYGDRTDAREPSLVTTAHRSGIDGDEVLALLHLELQAELLRSSVSWPQIQRSAQTLSPLLSVPPSAMVPEPAAWRANLSRGHDLVREVMALGQHYGVPTYGLDLTEELEIAVWFATHQADAVGPDTYRYRLMGPWVKEQGRTPCVYFFAVTSSQYEQGTLTEELAAEPLRPRGQHAFLYFGGWGWNSNAAAEELRAVAYLDPAFATQPHQIPVAEIFPPPEQDAFYAMLLERKAKARREPSSPLNGLYDHLPVISA